MAVRKTHVKSDKRIKREKEQREAAASTAKRQYGKKQKLGSKKKTIVDTRFKYKSQAERYKDISVDLASLIDDAVERFGRWDVQPEGKESKAAREDGMDSDSGEEVESDDEDEDMLSSPMSTALTELGLLNTSIPFHNLHKSLYPITRSLPLILHYKQTIANLLTAALTNPSRTDLALAAPQVIDLIPSFVQCLSPDPDFKQLNLETILTPLMKAIVSLAVDPPSLHIKTAGDRGNDPNSPVEISKRAFQVFAWMLRQFGSDIVNGHDYQNRATIAWSWVTDGLTGHKPVVEIQNQVEEDISEPVDEDVEELDEDVQELEGNLAVAEVPSMDEEQALAHVEGAVTEEIEADNDAETDSEDSPEDSDVNPHAAAKSSRRRPLSATRPHLRRLLATCFAFLLRRAKTGDNLDSIARIVLASVQTDAQPELCESISWLIIESVKSVESHIHSRGPAILRAFIREAIALQSRSAIEILSAALTGVVHHTRLDTLGDVSELVLARLDKITREKVSDFETELTLNLVCALCGTRRGARVSEKDKIAVLASLESLTAGGIDEGSSLLPLHVKALTVALLNAPNLQSMLDSGRKLLERVWQLEKAVSLRYAVFDTLSEQQWTYFRDFAIPLVKRAGSERLNDAAYVALLASLSERGQLPPLDTIVSEASSRFAQQISRWTVCFRNGKVTERQSQDLLDSLMVCSGLTRHEDLVASVLQAIDVLVAAHNNAESARLEFQSSSANSALLLSAFLKCLASIDAISSLTDDTIVRLVGTYHWHRQILHTLASAVSSRQPLSTSAASEVYDACKEELLSEDSTIRHSVLLLLEHERDSSVILKEALETECVPLTPQDARDKNMHLRRLGIALKTIEGTSEDFEIGLFYAFAMLKVNFKPLWSEAIDVIAEASKTKTNAQNLIWNVLLKQLRMVAEHDFKAAPESSIPEWALRATASPSASYAASWRQYDLVCTAFARLSGKFSESYSHFAEVAAPTERTLSAHAVQDQISDSRLSFINLEAQLLTLCARLHTLTEKHSRDFLDLFFRQFGQDDLEVNDGIGGKTGRERMSNWLKVVSSFKNPKALYRSEELYERMLQLLSHGDSAIQGLALDCILTWKSPALLPYETNLRNMLTSTYLRDELLQFSLAEDTSDIMPERRDQVVNITIRVLFGLMSSHQGRASAINVQRSRKSAIINALKACRPEDLHVLVQLMISSFQEQAAPTTGAFAFSSAPRASSSQQLGFLTLLGDIMLHLADKVRQHWNQLFQVTVNLAYHSRPSESSGERARHVRQLAFRRMSDFFKADPSFDASVYLPSIFQELITPRLPHFGAENAQGPSALMEIIAIWATHEETAWILVRYDQALLPALYSTMSTPNVKTPVIICVLDVIQKILLLSESSNKIRQELLEPFMGPLLSSISTLLAARASVLNSRDQIGIRLISVLSSISPFIAGRQYTEQLLPLLLPLLAKPNALIPENIKTDVLTIIEKLLSEETTNHLKTNESLLEQCYRTVCNLFATLRGRPGRVQTLSVFRKLQTARLPGSDVANLLDELNAFSLRRIDVPDFDRRLAAFQNLNDGKYKTLNPIEWIPVLANMFYFIQDPEELSIRSNANAALRRFVEVTSSSLDPACRTVFSKNFMPALKRALRSKVDLVRIESISVLQAAVQANSGFAELDEMKCLLAGDEEASFFVNVYHIQTHRRARALRRLAEEAQAGSLSSKTINDIFLPLVAYNLTAAGESRAQEVVNETVTTIGRLSSALHWSAYNRLVQQYFASAAEKRDNQKVYVRVLVAILKGFSFDLTSLSSSESTTILAAVENKLLPRLLQFLQSRNETEELLRIPIAEGVAVVVQHLPEDHRAGDVTNLITALAQILRSKSQEVRDMTRGTMVNIAISLGPEYLPIFFKELRASLAKGPHLHVLAFVVHALLERVLGAVPDANIDDCLGDAVPVVYDDLLGFPAKDRESTEFRSKTKYREVRLCKSMDSIDLLATHVSPNKINSLLGPLKGVLAVNDSLRTMQTVDDILRHIAAGALKNKQLDNTTLLTLSQALISQNTNFLKPRKPKGKKESQASKEYHVQMKRITHAGSDSYAQNAHKFVAFGLDLLNGAFKKNRFDLHDPETVSRLDPLITLVGNTLFAEEAHVLDRALRAVASLIKCPLVSIERAAPVLAKQMISILENMGGTASDLSQTTIRSLATLIRDRKSLVLSDDQLSTLVAIISPDLEEPDQQAALFSLLRAIVSRKFASPEVYDLMDRVAEILIASQSHGTREICRSIYLQFLLDYPQGKKRLSTSLQFLAKNLGGYLHESGRMSALELVNAILSKFGSDLLDQYADLFHVSLVMDLANDESAKCRSMAAENCKVLYAHVTAGVRQRLVDAIVTWGSQAENVDLQKVAAQTSGILVEAFKGKAELESLVQRVLPILITIVKESAAAMHTDVELEDGDFEDDTAATTPWQPAYQAATSLYKLLSSSPTSVHTLDSDFRKSLRSMLLFPHTWVRQAACRLLGLTFSLIPKTLSLEELIDAASGMTVQLQSKHLEDSLALQIVKNLFFIGKQFSQLDQAGQNTPSAGQPEAEEKDEEVDNGKENEEVDEQQGANGLFKRSPQSNPLHWLFVKLSHRARVAHQTKPSMYALGNRLWKWSIEPMSIMRWFAAMISEETIPVESSQKQLHQILLPVVRIVEDPNGAKDPQMDELQALAREVQEMLANRVGVSLVTEAYSKIQRNMAVKREGRKRTTALQAVTNPETEAQRRAKKNDSKKKNRKRKNESYKDTKTKYGVMSRGKRARQD